MTIRHEEQHKSFVDVSGSKMAYVDEGKGNPIVFLHGNPTSSYTWRNIIPHLSGQARCIAPDLIGMGDSDKLDGDDPSRYDFVQHRRYVSELLAKLGVEKNVVLVGHDWGAALAMDWAVANQAKVRGIAYFESIVKPRSWSEMAPHVRAMFERLRSPEGDDLVLRDNIFVEKLMPSRIKRKLSSEEMAVYQRPYLTPGEGRRPTLSFPRQIPLDGEPKETADLVQTFSDWMATSDVPKFFINGAPGDILTGEMRDYCRTWKNQTEVTVEGGHFLQEESPHEIGRLLAQWVTELPS